MRILIVGAASAIAQEAAKWFAKDGVEFFLVARSAEKLEDIGNDLKVRGAKRIETFVLDVNDLDRHQEMVEMKEFATNCTSVISLLTILANYFEQQRRGCIAVVSSVAGDRGRKSNYVYGASKGAVSIFLQGLRNRLDKSGVAVVTIKPGIVDTPMTAALKKGLLFANVRGVGQGVYQAMKKRKEVVYLPWYWRPVMFMLRRIPEPVFKKLSM